MGIGSSFRIVIFNFLLLFSAVSFAQGDDFCSKNNQNLSSSDIENYNMLCPNLDYAYLLTSRFVPLLLSDYSERYLGTSKFSFNTRENIDLRTESIYSLIQNNFVDNSKYSLDTHMKVEADMYEYYQYLFYVVYGVAIIIGVAFLSLSLVSLIAKRESFKNIVPYIVKSLFVIILVTPVFKYNYGEAVSILDGYSLLHIIFAGVLFASILVANFIYYNFIQFTDLINLNEAKEESSVQLPKEGGSFGKKYANTLILGKYCELATNSFVARVVLQFNKDDLVLYQQGLAKFEGNSKILPVVRMGNKFLKMSEEDGKEYDFSCASFKRKTEFSSEDRESEIESKLAEIYRSSGDIYDILKEKKVDLNGLNNFLTNIKPVYIKMTESEKIYFNTFVKSLIEDYSVALQSDFFSESDLDRMKNDSEVIKKGEELFQNFQPLLDTVKAMLEKEGETLPSDSLEKVREESKKLLVDLFSNYKDVAFDKIFINNLSEWKKKTDKVSNQILAITCAKIYKKTPKDTDTINVKAGVDKIVKEHIEYVPRSPTYCLNISQDGVKDAVSSEFMLDRGLVEADEIRKDIIKVANNEFRALKASVAYFKNNLGDDLSGYPKGYYLQRGFVSIFEFLFNSYYKKIVENLVESIDYKGEISSSVDVDKGGLSKDFLYFDAYKKRYNNNGNDFYSNNYYRFPDFPSTLNRGFYTKESLENYNNFFGQGFSNEMNKGLVIPEEDNLGLLDFLTKFEAIQYLLKIKNRVSCLADNSSNKDLNIFSCLDLDNPKTLDPIASFRDMGSVLLKGYIYSLAFIEGVRLLNDSYKTFSVKKEYQEKLENKLQDGSDYDKENKEIRKAHRKAEKKALKEKRKKENMMSSKGIKGFFMSLIQTISFFFLVMGILLFIVFPMVPLFLIFAMLLKWIIFIIQSFVLLPVSLMSIISYDVNRSGSGFKILFNILTKVALYPILILITVIFYWFILSITYVFSYFIFFVFALSYENSSILDFAVMFLIYLFFYGIMFAFVTGIFSNFPAKVFIYLRLNSGIERNEVDSLFQNDLSLFLGSGTAMKLSSIQDGLFGREGGRGLVGKSSGTLSSGATSSLMDFLNDHVSERGRQISQASSKKSRLQMKVGDMFSKITDTFFEFAEDPITESVKISMMSKNGEKLLELDQKEDLQNDLSLLKKPVAAIFWGEQSGKEALDLLKKDPFMEDDETLASIANSILIGSSYLNSNEIIDREDVAEDFSKALEKSKEEFKDKESSPIKKLGIFFDEFKRINPSLYQNIGVEKVMASLEYANRLNKPEDLLKEVDAEKIIEEGAVNEIFAINLLEYTKYRGIRW